MPTALRGHVWQSNMPTQSRGHGTRYCGIKYLFARRLPVHDHIGPRFAKRGQPGFRDLVRINLHDAKEFQSFERFQTRIGHEFGVDSNAFQARQMLQFPNASSVKSDSLSRSTRVSMVLKPRNSTSFASVAQRPHFIVTSVGCPASFNFMLAVIAFRSATV